jgi:hypothetical protein
VNLDTATLHRAGKKCALEPNNSMILKEATSILNQEIPKNQAKKTKKNPKNPVKWRSSERGFGPFVSGVSAAEFLTHLRIKSFPETGEISRGLHRALVGRQQV